MKEWVVGKQARRVEQPKAIIGYVRVSTERQGRDGISLELQRKSIRDYAFRRDLPLIEIFEDVATGAGARSAVSRTGLLQALKACRDHDGVLVVWAWSRLSRHVGSEKLLKDMLPAPDRILSLKEEETLPDAAKNARFVHAEEERNEISRRTKKAMDEGKKDGAVYGNPNIKIVQKSGTLAAKAKSDAVVLEIADFLRLSPDASKVTRRQVVDHLNANGLRTSHGNDWDVSRVTSPLRKAKELVSAEADETSRQLQKHPNFGLF